MKWEEFKKDRAEKMSKGLLNDEYADYQGCRNCEYQPEPLRMCAWGERRNRVEPICTGWKLRGSVKEGI